jgi:hypothetical protein
MEETQLDVPRLSISELLFPAFNSLLPLIFETVVPYLTDK